MNQFFGITSLFFSIISIQTILDLRKNWSSFWDTKITLKDRNLAERSSIFLLIPIGVLFHEIGHVLATWQVGGRVETFRWFVFSGYIIPSGDFTSFEYWWISFAGNLVSILFAMLPIPFIFIIHKRIIGEVLYKFVGIQAIYSLIYYPLWSAVYESGDWATIYSFQFQPYIFFLLIIHLGLLWGLWQLYNSKIMMQWRLSRHHQTLKTWQLLKAKHESINNLESQLELAYFLVEQKEFSEAKKIAKKISKVYPDKTAINVLQLFINCQNQKYKKVDYKKITKSAQNLLDADVNLKDRVILYRVLCYSLSQTNNYKLALDYANRGLAIAPKNYMLLYHRANIYHSFSEYQKAIADLELALEKVDDENIRELILYLKRQCLVSINAVKS